MSTTRRFAKNSLALLAARGVNLSLSLVFGIYAARALGDAGYGQYGFIWVVVAYCLVACEFGLEGLIVKDVARDKSLTSRYLFTSFAIKGTISLLSIGFAVGLAWALGKRELLAPTLVASLALLPTSLYMSYDALVRAHERMELIAAVEVPYTLLRTVAGIAVLAQGRGLVPLFTVFLGVEVLRLLLMALLFAKLLHPVRFAFDWQLLRYLVRESRLLALWRGLSVVYTTLGIVVLSAMAGDAPVGWYKAADNFFRLILNFALIAMNALLPILSQYAVSSRDRLRDVYRDAFKYIVIGMIPLATLLVWMAEPLIRLFYGPEYGGAVIALQLLAWSAVLTVVEYLQGTTVIALERFHVAARLYLGLTIVKLALTVVGVWAAGLVGACVASIVADALSVAAFVPIVTRSLGATRVRAEITPALAWASALLVLGVVLDRTGLVGPDVLIPGGLVCYALLLMKSRVLSPHDLQRIRAALG